ncbi:MAG: glycosyltransferase family 39 protein [Bdellovibrionales bacterium]|nr:glycosyltransferase family 39 protein [Bdellovibrionales bacterium]
MFKGTEFQKNYWTFLAILLLSVTLRALRLDGTGYWIDEMSSIHFATNPYWGAIFWDNSPGLYNFFLKIWILLFGDTESATRSLSILFSVLTTAVWLFFGYKVAGRRGAVILGLAHCVLSFSVYYARETRMYSMYELASTLVILGSVLLIEGQKISRLWLWAAVVFAMLTHYLAVVPIALGAFFFFLYAERDFKSKYKWDFLVAILISTLALLLIRWPSLDWQKLKYFAEPSSHWPWQVMGLVFGGAFGAVSIVLWSAYGVYKNNLYAKILGLGVSMSMVGACAATLLAERSLFLGRYFIFLLPLVVLSFLCVTELRLKSLIKGTSQLSEANSPSASVTWLRNTGVEWLGVLSLAIFLGAQLYTFSLDLYKEKPPWREGARILSEEVAPVVYTTRPLSLASPYYDRQGIKLVKFDPFDLHERSRIVEDAKNGVNVWVLENFWGASSYIGSFKALVAASGCWLKDQSVRNSNLEWIMLFKVQCDVLGGE